MDGAIHRGAGPRLLAACRALGGCPTGAARITPGFDLPATWVVHAVGPVWRGGGHGEDELLASCYLSALALAAEHGVRTIAFPAISTGAYGFPTERAARIAVREVANYLAGDGSIERVSLVCRGDESYRAHRDAYVEAVERGGPAQRTDRPSG